MEIVLSPNAGAEGPRNGGAPSRAALVLSARIAGLALVYALLARLGLLLDPVGGFATVVWAPTGVAISAVLLLGYRMTPGIWIGAFAANLLSGAPALTAGMIATGNTLEAVVAVLLLSRVRSFDRSLRRLEDVLVFALLGAVLAPAVSATIGMAALSVTNVVSPSEVVEGWRAWWVGDGIGALLVAPAVLVWHARGWRDLSSRSGEGLALLLALALVAALVFFATTPLEGIAFLQAYLVFPVLMWAAMRFEQRGAVSAVLLTSVVAVIGTANGTGPFVQGELRDSLFALQTFMGIVAMSVLPFSAAIAEREQAARTGSQLLAAAGVADRAKSDFLAAMSHELRTPLNAIAGYAQMLTMELHGSLSAGQREAVERIETNQRHLASLVADVLSFTRTEAGRLTINRETVGVAESLETLSAFISPEAGRKRVQVLIAPPREPLAVQADPERLRQILLNLLVNAIKFSEPGGRVELSVRRTGDAVHFVVSDRGIGIPADQLDRVFEPFFQVDRGHARRYQGVGLGLTISRELALAMGGDVTIESEAARGTTVTLVLAAAAEPAPTMAIPLEPA